jgi:NitT/TauT family transport system substrate-binding protein
VKASAAARHIAVLAAAALALAVAPAGAADLISISQYGINVETLPWAIALDKGILAKDGLNIDGFIGASGGGTSVRNMKASALPFAQMAPTAVAAAVQSGLDLRIVYAAVNNLGDLSWIVRKDSPIKQLSDLKGRKAGFTQPQSTTEMVLRKILETHKLTGDVTIVATGGIGAGLVALDQGAVDAVPFEEPLLLKNPDNYRVLFRVNDVLPNIVFSVGVTTPDFEKTHPDVIRKLLQAHHDAVDYMYAHPAEAAAVYKKVWNTDDPSIDAILPRLIKANYWSRNEINIAGLQTLLDAMQLVGALDKPIDAKSLVDTTFLH